LRFGQTYVEARESDENATLTSTVSEADRDGGHGDERDEAGEPKRVPGENHEAAILGYPARLKTLLDIVDVGVAADLGCAFGRRCRNRAGRLVGSEPTERAHTV
jgi:hypothetical protein